MQRPQERMIGSTSGWCALSWQHAAFAIIRTEVLTRRLVREVQRERPSAFQDSAEEGAEMCERAQQQAILAQRNPQER